MKTFRFFGLQLDLLFRLRRVKRVIFDLPDWADDTHVRQGRISDDEWGTPDGKTKVCYYKHSTAFYIDLPDAKYYQSVSITPMYCVKDGQRTRSTNRTITVDCYM
mgnify:CR=1 FL=1